ncbi:Alpha-catulin [Pseudolycoriella hygida]|uniref:Alpha-catulin n=1 Tax=Pseudolycoriella hygida TaxID=35572 RepID=A0A9Q0N921_9DIPT|nr:Alpha-catulin [Pseudolycoriella hygida]
MITTLVQHRSERSHVSSERTLRAIGRVGQAVSLAVERFVTVGETIADDNPEIRQDMYDACKEARAADSIDVANEITKIFSTPDIYLNYNTMETLCSAQ